MKLYVKILLAFVSLFAIAAILVALYMYNLKPADMTKATPDFVVSASALQKEFDENEALATSKYVNKTIEVSGTISSVKEAENNALSISLATESDFSSVICTFPSVSDPSKYASGQKITLRGECSGFLMDVLLNNCAVIDPK